MIVVVMMVSGLRVMWRRDRPVRAAVPPKNCVVMVGPYSCVPTLTVLPASPCLPSSPTMAKKTSSRVGCFSTYSTLAGGSSCLSSVEGAVDDDPTLVEDRDPVGEVFGLVQVLRREQHRGAVLGEFLDGLPHLDAPLGVEPGRRLVEEDDRRIPDQAHRDVEAAAHATGIGRHLPRGRVGQREPIEQVVRDRARVLDLPQLGDQHEVLAPAEDFVDGRELSGEADRLPHVRRQRGDVEAVDADCPGVGLEQRGQDLHDRGLAGPVGAEQGEDAAPRHVEVHAAQHLQLLVGLLQTPDVDGCVGGHRCCPRSASSIALIRRARSLSIHCLPV